MSGDVVSGEPQIHRYDRRRESRRRVEPYAPLWVYCKAAAIGGQAALCDVSASGVGITVAGRYARRLLQALRRAEAAVEPVELSCIADDWHCRARVAWIEEGDYDLTRIGLALVEPRGAWTRGTRDV
jgi:hypothetical protein